MMEVSAFTPFAHNERGKATLRQVSLETALGFHSGLLGRAQKIFRKDPTSSPRSLEAIEMAIFRLGVWCEIIEEKDDIRVVFLLDRQDFPR